MIYRNISDFIYDILDLVQILWKTVLIFVFYCSLLSFPYYLMSTRRMNV